MIAAASVSAAANGLMGHTWSDADRNALLDRLQKITTIDVVCIFVICSLIILEIKVGNFRLIGVFLSFKDVPRNFFVDCCVIIAWESSELCSVQKFQVIIV